MALPMTFSSPEQQALSDISVLVIDDEQRIRDACLAMLMKDGYSADAADNVEAGLALLAERHVDIILLDLMMPGMSGLEGLASIRAAHPDTVVIVITGYATLEHSIEAMKKGAFDFIAKPFSPDSSEGRAKRAPANWERGTKAWTPSTSTRRPPLLKPVTSPSKVVPSS